MKNLKAKTVKAFTLVELIVVMVILAILIGLTVPSVAKYIDKAGKITVLSDARSVLTTMQAYAADAYGESRTAGTALQNNINSDVAKANRSQSTIYTMSGVKGYIKNNVTVNGSRILSFEYYASSTEAASNEKVVWTESGGFVYYKKNASGGWDKA